MTPRNPHVVLFAFSAGPLAAGAPVRTITRAQDPAWFDAWRTDSLRAIASQDLGGDLAQLDAADQMHLVTSEPHDVTDLSYLADAWAQVAELSGRGASIVLDAMAMTYVNSSALPAADDLSRQIRVVYETDPARSDRAHAIHTRGMRKFGAPDLVALVTDKDVALVAPAIRELAEQVARGTDLATPVHVVEIAPGVRWVAVEDEHRLGELLQLGNSARVLVGTDGHDLAGVVDRLRNPRN